MPELTPRSIETRRTRVGASEVGALLGLHPYTDEARIYARIVDGDTIRQTASMGVGKALERVTLRMAAAELGLRVHACSKTYIYPDLPLAATPDAYARVDAWTAAAGDAAFPLIGRGPGLVEVKVSGDYALWTDLPPFVEWQVRAQLALTDRDWAFVAALVGSTLRTYLVERDLSLEAELLNAVDRFDRLHLTPRVPPVTDDVDLVLRWSPRAGEILAGTDPPVDELGHRYADLVRERRSVEKEEKTARDLFALAVAARGAKLVVGNGWNASVDERGALRMNVKRG